MHNCNKKLDLFYLVLLIMILAGLPVGIVAYNHYTTTDKIPPQARMFTLTGHAERGWLIGEAQAYDAVTFWHKQGQPVDKPLIEVTRGDQVVFKLTSSDVVHGFSLKDFGVFLTDGIQPGKPIFVTFTADKVGTFTFSCNAICGDMHKNMQGTLVVKA
jgi:heme/copper-type cytochrome/quinol oxidase subunit 2